MEPIWLLVGLSIGVSVGAWVTFRVTRARYDGAETAAVARLQAQLEAAQTVSGAREELLALVKQGAGEELAQRGSEVVDLIKAHLGAALTHAGADDEERKRAIAGLVQPLNQTLLHLKERLDKVDEARERTSNDLNARLQTVATGQEVVARNAAALERALRQPQVRGRWGELGLRRLAELAGMSQLCDFTEQSSIDDDGRVLRPDVLIQLPFDRLVVVDAKVPLAPFLDAMQATTEGERVETLKLFARGMRNHVRNLAEKSYAAQFSTAPDFVVMYVPGDPFLGGALEVDSDLLEDAFSQRVHIATPATLLALLRTVAYAFQQQRVAEDAQAIAKLGRDLYDRFGTLLEHIDKVSRCVNSLVKAQDEVIGSLERRVLPKARKFSELGVAGADETLPELRPVGAMARRVTAEELTAGAEIRVFAAPVTEPGPEATTHELGR
jgi:DNA recombination protein RmuC